MNVSALVCARCGGPLALVTQLPAIVECQFCNAVMSVSHQTMTLTKEGTGEPHAALARPSLQEFCDEVSKALEAKVDPYLALNEASAKYLGDPGRSDVVARVSLALARDFERETGATIVGEGPALARIASAYINSVIHLSDRTNHGGTDEINLPFIAVKSGIPIHLRRTVTAASFAELARRDPHEAPAAPQPVSPEPAQEEPKKRKKLFGLF
jgi:hypothetical protein